MAWDSPTAPGVVSSKTSWASHMWLTLAIATLTGPTRHGAMKFRDTIAAAMTSAQVIEAQRLAGEWTPISERSGTH